LRLSELSRESGVPVAMIKYYLREGLLEPGTPVNARQVAYGDAPCAACVWCEPCNRSAA